MATTFTLTGKAADLVGDDFAASDLTGYVESSQDVINEADVNRQRYGRKSLSFGGDGTWSVELVGTGDLVQAYRVVIRTRDRILGVKTVESEWFELEANSDFGDVLEVELVAVQTSAANAASAAASAAAAAASAAEAEAVANLTGEDDVVAALVEDDTSDTRAALSATFASLNEDGELVVDGEVIETGGGGSVDDASVAAVLDEPLSKAVIDAIIALAPKTPLPGPLEKTPVYAYGHSYLAGAGITGGRDIAARLTQRVGTTVTNRATSGNALNSMMKDATGENSGGAKTWTPGTKGVVVIDATINDARTSPDAAFTTPQINAHKETFRSALRIFRASARVATGSGTIVRTGFAPDFGGYNYSSNPAELVTITPGAGITKIYLGVGMTGDDPATRGFEVSTDGGTTYTTVSAIGPAIGGNITPWLVPVTLPDGGTVRIRPLSGRTVFFRDYWVNQNLTPPSFVLVKDVPLGKTGMSPTGATLLTDPQYATSLANLAAINAAMVAVAAEPEWAAGTVVIADPSIGWDFTTDVSTDLVHPNSIGAWKYANAIQNAGNLLVLRDGMTPL